MVRFRITSGASIRVRRGLAAGFDGLPFSCLPIPAVTCSSLGRQTCPAARIPHDLPKLRIDWRISVWIESLKSSLDRT